MNNEPDELIPTRWTLIERLKNWEDQGSWRDFFDTYWKLIYGVAIRSGLSHQEAQDVVQETIVSVSKKMKDFKADPAFGSFKSWLLNLTRWRITDRVRRRGREALLDGGGPNSNSATDTIGTAAEARVPDPAGSELDRIWEEEWQKQVIAAALEKVKHQASAKHYQVFYLNVIKQSPPAKVAETLGVAVDQVYLIKHRLTKVFEEAVREVETNVR